MNSEIITVVSGLPRSGTSMMMNMLAAGGMPVLTDALRAADEDNPRGYFELHKVKQLDKDNSWLPEATGKAVKIVSPLLKHLPGEHRYRIIFMHRDLNEILASQKQMLIRRSEPTDTVADEKMAQMFRKHLSDIEKWLAEQPNISVLYVDYGLVLGDPGRYARAINEFVSGDLDVEKMASVADKSLHRQQR